MTIIDMTNSKTSPSKLAVEAQEAVIVKLRERVVELMDSECPPELLMNGLFSVLVWMVCSTEDNPDRFAKDIAKKFPYAVKSVLEHTQRQTH